MLLVRSKGQELYDIEKYYMQLDSHMRFAYDWDIGCIEMLEGLRDAGIKKLFSPLMSVDMTLLNWGGDEWEC